LTKVKKTSFNVPLIQFGYLSYIDIIDIPQKTLWEYHNQSVKYMYETGILKKGDKYSVKNNKHSFTITRYRK
jgi:hypothetical protein